MSANADYAQNVESALRQVISTLTTLSLVNSEGEPFRITVRSCADRATAKKLLDKIRLLFQKAGVPAVVTLEFTAPASPSGAGVASTEK